MNRHPTTALAGRIPRAFAAGVAVVLVWASAACGGSVADYRSELADAAATARSALQTALLAAQAAADGDTYDPYLSVALEDAEDDYSGAQDDAALSTPPAAEAAAALYDDLNSVLDDGASGLAHARIAVEQQDRQKLVAAADEMHDAAEDLLTYLDPELREQVR